MNILLTGSDGQLGYELRRTVAEADTLIAVDKNQLDICDSNQLESFFSKEPLDLVINASAYTAVDKAEKEKDSAWLVNQQGAENLANACHQHSINMVQISTDFVFSGDQFQPYLPDDKAESKSVYGLSKHAGDEAVLKILQDQALIIRTSWLYSAHGGNFVKTMLKFMQERDSLGIIVDQVGTPTWAKTLADCIWLLIDSKANGIYHCADNGVASWYDFAVAIQEEALELGLLDKQVPIAPIRTEQYPTPAARPAYSVMDKSKTEKLLQLTLPHWRVSLRNMLKEI